MAGSFPIFDASVRHLLTRIAPAQALDIGAGRGKYGRLLADCVPGCERVALEVDAAHVERFALRDLYHRVHLEDATRWWREQPDEAFDLVIAGDCLQTMPKSDGLDLLNAMSYRCAWLLVLVPEFVAQGCVDGAWSAVHRSVWSERDMHWHDLWAWDNSRAVSLILLRGYRVSPIGIEQVVHEINAGAVPIHDFDGQTVVRPLRLRLIDHAREVPYRPR